MAMERPSSPAETYESYFVPAMFRPWADVLLRHAALRPGDRVLDLACGTGVVARLAASLLGKDGLVAGTDLDHAMLSVARRLPAPAGAALAWQRGDAVALPFLRRAFDVVLCQHGLQLMTDQVAVVREIRRVLAAGGRAVAIVLQDLARHPLFEALMRSVARQLSLPVSAVATPFSLGEADALRDLFTSAGFAQVDIVEESTTVSFPEPQRFVPLAVASSAAAVPAFAQLQAPERAALIEAVRAEVEPIVREHCDGEVVTFPMFAHLAIAPR